MNAFTRFFHVIRLGVCLLIGAILASACAALPAVSAVSNLSPSNNSQQMAGMASYTLKTGEADGKMVFFGVGGDIDGKVNPDLHVQAGAKVDIILIDGEGMLHNLTVPDFHANTKNLTSKDTQDKIDFTVGQDGVFPYFCSIPGHRQAGMEGKLIVGSGKIPEKLTAPDIVRDPTDLPAPVGARPAQKIRVYLEAVELTGQLADGTTYPYWTFNGKVPGPFVRVRVGDEVEVHLKNNPSSSMSHSVDFHAVTGPGGGAVMTQSAPGKETSFTFKALNPGLFVYHCATPSVAHHIASGMFGLILVEPEGGLPKVDHEFYVMQSEIYTQTPYGQPGALAFSEEKLSNETPEYYVFNGAAGGLTTSHMLKARVGDTVRIFFGDAGPNKISSFHVIGEIFDRVYDQASLTSPPLTDVQTTLVPAGGATMVEFKLQVPGRFILVDHALSRMERGLAGYLMVDGEKQPEIYDGTQTPGSGH